MKNLIVITLALAVSGCSILPFGRDEVKPIEVVTKAKERAPLDLPDPQPIEPLEVKWVVITPENAEEVFAKLQKDGVDLVLFGLTDDGYERLSINMVKIRNYIDSQRTIIIKYKDYYEKKPEE